MIGCEVLNYSDGIPVQFLDDPNLMNGFNLAFANNGTVPIRFVCPGFLLDNSGYYYLYPGKSVCFRAIEGRWVILSNTAGIVSNRASLAASTNNYNPGYFDKLYITSSANISITGIEAGLIDGEERTIINSGLNDVTLPHESGSSLAANRFTCQGSADIVLKPGFTARIICDLTAGRWRAIPE